MSELLQQAVWGAVVGATMGASRRSRPFAEQKFYDPIPLRMAPSESLDAWVVACRHIRQEKPLPALSQSYERHWPSLSDETRFGLGAVAAGFSSPISGALFNPLPRGSNGFLRAALWGLIHHGDPDTACEWGFIDASMDHAGDGAWLPAACARMIAVATPGMAPTKVLRAGLDVLPPDSLFLRAAPMILEHAASPNGLTTLNLKLPRDLGISDAHDAALAMAAIAIGLVRGSSFGPRVLATASFGGAADQACAVSAILACLLEGETPKDWRDPLSDPYIASHALRGIDLPETIAEFAEMVLKARLLINPAPLVATPVAESAIVVHDPDLEPDAVEPVAEVSPAMPAPSDLIRKLLAHAPDWAQDDSGSVTVALEYLDGAIYRPGQPMNLALIFRNDGKREKAVEPEIVAPEKWSAAARLQPFRLPPDHETTFPVVARSDADEGRARLTVNVGRNESHFPFLPADAWWMVGPLDNAAGDGFEKVFPAETVHIAGQVFNGRSGLPAKWERTPLAPVLMDLEPFFKHSAGTLILWARVRLPKPGTYSLVASFGMGVVASVDGQRVIRYHDQHEPTHKPVAPYRGEFRSTGESVVVVKILRGTKPLPSGALYFLDEDGALVLPDAFLPMKA